MKKIIAVVAILFAATCSVFADWERSVGAGLEFDVFRDKIFVDDLDDPVLDGTGVLLDAQFRMFKKNSKLSLMGDFNLGVVKVDGTYGGYSSLVAGVGANFSKSKNLKLVLSGIVGAEAMKFDYEETVYDFVFGYEKDTGDVLITNFVLGADFYVSYKLTDHLALFGEATTKVGIGAGEFNLNQDAYIVIPGYGRTLTIPYSASYNDSGLSTGINFSPKIGVCWYF